MNKTVRLTALTLAVSLLLGGCMNVEDSLGSSGSTGNDSGSTSLVGSIRCEFPLTTDDVSLNILTTGYGNISAEDVFVWKEYEKMTGVDINWETISKSERKERVYNVLTNKSDVDLIIRCKISSDTLIQYGENDLIYNLAENDMLQKYAPNCWAYLQSHPDALASVTNPDGTIYALPQINSGAELRVSRKIFINKTWLERTNTALPTTTEEFYQLLKIFKEQDVNQNGDVNDEIPLCTQDWLSIQEAFSGAFGLGNRGIHNLTVDCDEATGKVRLIASADGYKSFLQYFNRLYSEGLMDQYTFTMTLEQWLNNIENDLVGVFINTNLASLPADKTDNWVAVGEALEGPDGFKIWSAVRANFHSTGAAVIPATCDNPELVLRWLDYFWTNEGTLFYHMGVENETFVSNGDGTYDYLPSIYAEMGKDGKSFDDVIAQYSPYPGGGNPTVEIAPYFMGGEVADVPAAAARALFEYGPEVYWPSFTFTSDENEQLNILQADLSKYIVSSRVDFITGVKSFDDWDDYVRQLEKLGAGGMLEIYQAAVDRYNALVA